MGRSRRWVEQAAGEYIEIGGPVAGALKPQTRFDLEAFDLAAGRTQTVADRQRFAEIQTREFEYGRRKFMNGKKVFMLAASIVACLGAQVTEAAAQRSINSCQTVADSGSYVLSRNLTATDDCLVIAADDVTIDLNGYAITGKANETGAGTGIGGGGSRLKNITVRNGGVTNFQIGIALNSSAETTVERMRVTQNTVDGIRSGANSIVRDNISNGNGRHGIRVLAASLVAGNVANNNGSGGIFTSCPGNTIGNSATGNGSNYISQVGCTRYNNNPE